MVMKVQQIPALFLPKRGANDKHPIAKTPEQKKKFNSGKNNEQKTNDAKKCPYILRTD